MVCLLRGRWWEGSRWGGISSTEQTARSGSPQLFYTESRTGKIPMSTKTNAINIIMKKTQKLPCFGYNMLCKGSTHWIEDNICFLLGPLSNAFERSEIWYLSKEIVLERCRWYPFCWMKRKINRDRRRQITGQTWPWVRATPSSPVSPYSKVSTKSLPRTGLLSLDLHVHWKYTGVLAIFGEYLFLDFTYELKFSLKCNFLKYIVLIESMSTNVAILENVIFIKSLRIVAHEY